MRRNVVWLSHAVAALVVVLTLSAPASATSITFGTNNGANGFPFNNYGNGNEYQQVYSSTGFSGPLTIDTIGFASASPTSPGTTKTLGAIIKLSTVSIPVGGLSTNFASNEGANVTQVFSGTETFTTATNGSFDLVFDTTPFVYNPSQGNLLMDIVITSDTGQFTMFEYGNTSLMERAYNSVGPSCPQCANTGQGGVVTQFTDQPAPQVPEPASLLLMATGLSAAFFKRRATR